MSPALLTSSVFFDPNDLNDADAILHYDDDPIHSTHVCMNCHRIESPDNKLIPCTQCKAVFYCDVVCFNENWSSGRRGGTHHKNVCKAIQRSHKKRPAMQAIAKQFPWTRQTHDGSCTFDRYRDSRGLFGCGPNFGWWTESPCSCEDQMDYMPGAQLLEDEHFDERQGWKLPDDEIPWLDFESTNALLPSTPPNFDHTWASYYKWRGLPMRSPAALLLHWPLSVFRLLSQLHCLPSDSPLERRSLIVHLLGVEKELDVLPIFGELALLIPNTDIDLVMFGPGVFRVLIDADEDEDCLASQPYAYTYTAPDACGGSTIRISLSDSGPIWGDHAIHTASNRPDAMIALNANLGGYDQWQLALLASRAYNIPFAVTERQEVNIELSLTALRDLPQARATLWAWVELGQKEEKRMNRTAKKTFARGMNPFMCPGPRPQTLGGGPTTPNGFEFIVATGGPDEDMDPVEMKTSGPSLDDYM
ncbi:hypothetical protein P691DRAFT_809413 [Macrolepiota fuliginosa MF-IS2]|uniref:MYND-type domain-containing protein n=1 Tax=Macrolepiota fuliginosa MF-IS2 TaxID=1400762 RepID=A0A9P5X4A9_9AGAR|nr:hypothetical protein P691DRAFT_809413 [Macrolepiota fuliginosa MF-IS2]